MRTHGWAGSVPVDDAEATARILAAARSAIDEHGVATTISDVARTLGVTRQTVYRYFPSTEALLRATALDAVGAFLERIALRVSGICEPDAAVVEGIDVVLQELPDDRYVGLLFAADNVSLFAVEGVTSEAGQAFARSMVERMDVDWAARGYGPAEMDIIVEIVLRTLQSMMIDHSTTRSGAQRRAFLDAWAGAAIRALPTGAAVPGDGS